MSYLLLLKLNDVRDYMRIIRTRRIYLNYCDVAIVTRAIAAGNLFAEITLNAIWSAVRAARNERRERLEFDERMRLLLLPFPFPCQHHVSHDFHESCSYWKSSPAMLRPMRWYASRNVIAGFNKSRSMLLDCRICTGTRDESPNVRVVKVTSYHVKDYQFILRQKPNY